MKNWGEMANEPVIKSNVNKVRNERKQSPPTLSSLFLFFSVYMKEGRSASEPVSSPRTTFGCAKTFRGVVVLIGDTAAVIPKFQWWKRVVVAGTVEEESCSAAFFFFDRGLG